MLSFWLVDICIVPARIGLKEEVDLWWNRLSGFPDYIVLPLIYTVGGILKAIVLADETIVDLEEVDDVLLEDEVVEALEATCLYEVDFSEARP